MKKRIISLLLAATMVFSVVATIPFTATAFSFDGVNVCSNCGSEDGYWEVIVEPSCMNQGLERFYCNNCGHGEDFETPHGGHIYIDPR